MKGFLSSSFRNRLFVGFLAASLIPLLLCSALLLQFFRVQLTGRERQAADSSLGDACQLLEQTRMGFMRAAEDISRDEVMLSALRSTVIRSSRGAWSRTTSIMALAVMVAMAPLAAV